MKRGVFANVEREFIGGKDLRGRRLVKQADKVDDNGPANLRIRVGLTLPKNVEQTHISLFDDSNCGIALKDKPVFSVQYHPEASPGPRDSHYLFTRFADLMRAKKRA